MIAVIETGGKQYKVAKGDTLDIEKLEEKEGASVKLDKVLLVDDKVGTPTVSGASVSAKAFRLSPISGDIVSFIMGISYTGISDVSRLIWVK